MGILRDFMNERAAVASKKASEAVDLRVQAAIAEAREAAHTEATGILQACCQAIGGEQGAMAGLLLAREFFDKRMTLAEVKTELNRRSWRRAMQGA
jgi:hypothetical protein